MFLYIFLCITEGLFLTNRFVLIAMEALDTLLVTCHAHSLNLFVESYLKMVQKLLEQNDAELQCVATQSVSTVNSLD